MAVKILYATGLFVLGFFWFYLGGRQLLFNFFTAFPLVRRYAEKGVLDGLFARRYTVISCVIWVILLGIVAGVIVWLCPIYQLAGFVTGAMLSFILTFGKLGLSESKNTESFIIAYSRFMPDAEIRQAAASGDKTRFDEAVSGCLPE